MSAELTPYQGDALSPANLDHSLELASKLAKSDLLPQHFKGKPENVLLVLALAQSLNLSPVMCLQQVSVIGGKPCLQASLMISLLNNSNKLRGPLRFRFEGDPGTPRRSCLAYGEDATTGETIEGEPVSLAMAQAEGWTRNPKYKSLPDTMLKWRAASFFIRTYYPEVVLGLHTAEELVDVQAATSAAPDGSARARLAELRAKKSGPEIRDVTPVESSSAEAVEVAEPAEQAAAPEGEPDNVLLDFLLAVAEETDADALTEMARQCADFDNEAKVKTAKRAVMEQAKRCELVWDKESMEFVKQSA